MTDQDRKEDEDYARSLEWARGMTYNLREIGTGYGATEFVLHFQTEDPRIRSAASLQGFALRGDAAAFDGALTLRKTRYGFSVRAVDAGLILAFLEETGGRVRVTEEMRKRLRLLAMICGRPA
jgi:hypothetical protein